MLLRKIREKEKRVCVCVWEKGSLFVWLFDICGLQFGIVREVCYCLVLVLRFGDLLSLGALQLLDLLCDSLFGLYAIHIWYLVFVFGICEPLVLWFVFGSLVLYLWERAIWVYLGFGFVRVPLHQFVLFQICYSEICSSSSVDVGYCRTT